jgi:hypothetical protein
MVMAKGESLRRDDACSGKTSSASYDYIKTVIGIARKNGWDLDSLGLIEKDLPAPKQVSLTRKQVMERNRLVKSILKRFSRILTPPVPLDLEKSIRSKGDNSLLPWETEVLEKAEKWRKQVTKAKPEILDELRRAIISTPEAE